MGLFTWLLAAVRPKRISDPLFGKLLFMKAAAGYWEGRCEFIPLGHQIEVFIDAGEGGPSEQHREFYRLIEQRFPELMESLRPVLEREYRGWMHKDLVQTVEEEFALSSLSIPDGGVSPLEWEVTFECASDQEHVFTVTMKDWSPEIVTIDG